MNLKRIIKLRDFIKTLPPKAISMPDLIVLDKPNETLAQACKHTCGTTACIAGWAVLRFGPRTARFELGGTYNPDVLVDRTENCKKPIWDLAKDLLGLDGYEADYLFNGLWSDKSIEEIKKSDVLRQLNKMIRTVDKESEYKS